MRLRLRRSTSNNCAIAWRRATGGKQQTAQTDVPATGNANALKPRGCVRTHFRNQRYQQHCMRPFSEKNNTSVGRVRDRCRRRWRAAPRSNAHEHRSVVEVRDDVVAERAFGCREVHEESPSSDWQRPSVEWHHTQYLPHVLQARVHSILRVGPKTLHPEMLQLAIRNTRLNRKQRYDRQNFLRNWLVQAISASTCVQMRALFYHRLASQKLSPNRCHCPRCELHGTRLKHRASGSRQLLRQVPGR